MEIENQITDPQAQVNPENGSEHGSQGGGQTAAPDYYGWFSKEFEVDVKDEDSFRQAKERFTAPKKPEYKLPWMGELVEKMNELESADSMFDYMEKFTRSNRYNWEEIGKNAPMYLLQEGLRVENPDLNEKQIAALFKQQYGKIPFNENGSIDRTAFRAVDDEGNPVDYDGMDAETAFSLAEVTVKKGAKSALEKLNSMKRDIAPQKKEVVSPLKAVEDTYESAAKKVASSFKLGDNQPPLNLGEGVVSKVASPDTMKAVLSEVLDKEGNVNAEFIAKYALFKEFIEGGHFKKIVESAQGKGTAEVLDKIQNPQGNQGTRTPAGGPSPLGPGSKRLGVTF